MLYKYVKSQPIVISDSTAYSLDPLKRRKTMYGFAVACFCFGILSITYSIYPYAQAAYFKTGNISISKNVLTASSDDIGSSEVLGKAAPTSQNYTENVNKNIADTNRALNLDVKTHPELADVKGEMKLSIPKLGLKKLPVVINVSSYDESVYLPILETKLAHFKGTSLPDNTGNVFVYGHSTNELWARTNPTHPEFAFTYLNKLDIGDSISLEYNGKTFNYILQKAKTVSPEDVSPIFTTDDKKTLTLMTCWPPGVGTERLILIADQE